MNKKLIIRLTIAVLIAVSLLVVIAYYRYIYNKPYNLLANPYHDIKQALASTDNNRPLLIVLGANWCPECRNIALELNTSPLKDVIESSFELVKIDVNGWDRNMDIVEALGNPVKGGIPTILLIDNNKRIFFTRTGTQLAIDKKNNGSYLNYFTRLSRDYLNRDKSEIYNDVVKLNIE